jgi:hypothetical protein
MDRMRLPRSAPKYRRLAPERQTRRSGPLADDEEPAAVNAP